MKVLWLIYDAEHDEYVMEVLGSWRGSGYTKWDRVLGRGIGSEPRMDDAVWPGYNCSIMMAVDEGQEEQAREVLRKLHVGLGGKGIEAFELPAARFLLEKKE